MALSGKISGHPVSYNPIAGGYPDNISLVSTLTCVGTLTASLDLIRYASWVGTISGFPISGLTISGGQPLKVSASLTNLSKVKANARVIRYLTCSLEAEATCTADATVDHPISCSLEATSTCTADARVDHPISCSVSATSACMADARITRHLACSLEAEAALTGHLDVTSPPVPSVGGGGGWHPHFTPIKIRTIKIRLYWDDEVYEQEKVINNQMLVQLRCLTVNERKKPRVRQFGVYKV